MFILPALAAHPLTDVAPQFPLRPCTSVSISALDIKLRVSPLTALLTALLASILLRAVVVTALRRVRKSAFGTGKHRRSPSVEDGAARDGVDPVADKPTPSKGQWYDGVFALDVLQPISLAEALPITLHPPPPPTIRGGRIWRGGRGVGFVRRPERAVVAGPKPRLESTGAVPGQLEPALVAKLILSRHTYRRPAPHTPSATPPHPDSARPSPRRPPPQSILLPSRSPSPEPRSPTPAPP